MRYLSRYDTLRETLHKFIGFTRIRKNFFRLPAPPPPPKKTKFVNVYASVTVGNVERTSQKLQGVTLGNTNFANLK